jgi:hypothetical protein
LLLLSSVPMAGWELLQTTKNREKNTRKKVVSCYIVTHTMAPTTRAQRANWAVGRATALPEFWALLAEHSGLVGACRLTGVCRASRVGAKEWLRTLRRLLVCGGYVSWGEGHTKAVWRLDLGELRWERMPDLLGARHMHACCAVRGNVVVLGGEAFEEEDEDEFETVSTVEVLRSDSETEEHAFTALPPLPSGPRFCSIAHPIKESEIAEGQVILLGGRNENIDLSVVKVDLATGACTPHPPLLYGRWHFAAARLSDGRVVCAGGGHHEYREDDEAGDYPASVTAEVLEAPEQGSPDGAWRWRELPRMRVHRFFAAGCVLSDGRFAVFGGMGINSVQLASCEVLSLDGDERWEPLPPMLNGRCGGFICAAVGGCVIVAGGANSSAVEVYEEGLRRWRRLPCNFPHDGYLVWTGSELI